MDRGLWLILNIVMIRLSKILDSFKEFKETQVCSHLSAIRQWLDFSKSRMAEALWKVAQYNASMDIKLKAQILEFRVEKFLKITRLYLF